MERETGRATTTNSTATVLAPLCLASVRAYFRRTYQLEDPQIDTLLATAKADLHHHLQMAEAAWEAKDLAAVAIAAHSIKGVLLNMGETEWSGAAKAIELAAKAGETLDYHSKITSLRGGITTLT